MVVIINRTDHNLLSNLTFGIIYQIGTRSKFRLHWTKLVTILFAGAEQTTEPAGTSARHVVTSPREDAGARVQATEGRACA